MTICECRLVGQLVNKLERTQRKKDVVEYKILYYPGICLKGMTNRAKTWVRIGSVSTEIWTGNIPNTSLKPSRSLDKTIITNKSYCFHTMCYSGEHRNSGSSRLIKDPYIKTYGGVEVQPYAFFTCKSWDCHSGGYEEHYILGYNVVWSIESKPTFRRSKNNPSKNKTCVKAGG